MVEEGDLDDRSEDKATNEVVDDVKKVAMEGVDKENKQVACRTPVGPYNYPLSPIQYPGITVIFKTFTFVLIDLLSPVMGRSRGSQGVKG